MRYRLAWLGAVAFVFSAWVAGRVLWRTGETEGFGVLSFSWFDVLPFALVLPVVLTGVRLARSGRLFLRVLGWSLVGAAILALAFGAFWSSFGGFCLDPGEDICVVPVTAHVAHAIAPVVVLLIGWLYANRLTARRG